MCVVQKAMSHDRSDTVIGIAIALKWRAETSKAALLAHEARERDQSSAVIRP
jgi:hypothetical protein